MKCRGKRDTAWNSLRSNSFSPLHFMLYLGKPITFGTVYALSAGPLIHLILSACVADLLTWLVQCRWGGGLPCMTSQVRWAGWPASTVSWGWRTLTTGATEHILLSMSFCFQWSIVCNLQVFHTNYISCCMKFKNETD